MEVDNSREEEKIRMGDLSNIEARVDDSGDEDAELLMEEVVREDISDDSEYALERNFESGRLLLNLKDREKVKTVILLGRGQLEQIMDAYLKMNEWNEAVEKI